MADYRLPQLLMEYGVIKITEDTMEKLHLELKDADIENTIRAATVVACDHISKITKLSCVLIDRFLWNEAQKLINLNKMTTPAMRVATRCY